jgi:hypothetical protein
MAHAYTPGLHVSERTRLRKHRRLPLPGEVLAEKGQVVSAETVVARAELPGDVVLINAVSQLGCTPGELASYLTKGQGDEVRQGELIGETRPWIKLFRSQLTAPAAGTLESISAVTGQIVLRKPPRPIELAAYVDGRVVEVVPGEGVDVEVEASFIQGIGHLRRRGRSHRHSRRRRRLARRRPEARTRSRRARRQGGRRGGVRLGRALEAMR